jgi:hypothetical protein
MLTGPVRVRTEVRCVQSKIRPLVHKAAIFGSVTRPRAAKTVRARETKKSQNCQYRDKQKRHHTDLMWPSL